MSVSPIKIIECPRDAMQGLQEYIPTDIKIKYLNSLLKVGFDTLDFGSFVSPKAIPQLRDTGEVVNGLDLTQTETKLLAIVANKRGAEEACQYEQITYLGYPFSISPTFLQKNINSTLDEAYQRAEEILTICQENKKTMVVYVSMAFGNPYGDEWSEEILFAWMDKLVQLDIPIISLADTVGLALPNVIGNVIKKCLDRYPDCQVGLHLHTTLDNVIKKLEAAYSAGCRRFDGVLDGLGGCPMAGTGLVGNLNTQILLDFFRSKQVPVQLNTDALKESVGLSQKYFPH